MLQTTRPETSSRNAKSSSGSGTASVQTGGAIYPCMFSVTSVLSKQ